MCSEGMLELGGQKKHNNVFMSICETHIQYKHKHSLYQEWLEQFEKLIIVYNKTEHAVQSYAAGKTNVRLQW